MKKYEINTILVPVDFSTVAYNAMQTAVAISKRQLSTITLMYVVENTFVLFPPEISAAAGSLLPQLVKDANENLSNLAKDLCTKHDIVVNHIVQSGNPADEVCRWALHKKMDLIVMGTHGASGLREFFMGSNAYRVVKNAPCPVLSVPGHHQWLDFKKILFPVRMVPHALDKYEAVRPIVRKNGSSLLVAGIVKHNEPASLIEMKALVDTMRRQISEDEVICGSDVYYCENPARQVLNIADDTKPDLIVITATLDNTVKEFFLGPYTQDIVNHSRFPVLSIKPEIELEGSWALKILREQSHNQQVALA